MNFLEAPLYGEIENRGQPTIIGSSTLVHRLSLKNVTFPFQRFAPDWGMSEVLICTYGTQDIRRLQWSRGTSAEKQKELKMTKNWAQTMQHPCWNHCCLVLQRKMFSSFKHSLSLLFEKYFLNDGGFWNAGCLSRKSGWSSLLYTIANAFIVRWFVFPRCYPLQFRLRAWKMQ